MDFHIKINMRNQFFIQPSFKKFDTIKLTILFAHFPTLLRPLSYQFYLLISQHMQPMMKTIYYHINKKPITQKYVKI